MKNKNKLYNLAWLDLKHYISKKYSEVTDLKSLEVLNDIIKYIDSLEKAIQKEDK